MNKKPYIRISPDIDVLFVDGDSCCASAYGDEIGNDSPWLGPRFSIVVPGIDEWVRRYEDATDFAETTTDPSFDWISWHYEGLCFAKAIWEQMPRCYTLYYEPPFEDHSGTIGEVIIDENVDSLIGRLRPLAKRTPAPLSRKDNIEYQLERKDDCVQITFRINNLVLGMPLSFKSLPGIKQWLKDIIDAKGEVCTIQLTGYNLHYARQTVGSHPEMGRFWISKNCPYNDEFTAYVDTKEFVRGFYLSLMTELGFGIYEDIDNHPEGEERNAVWKPYNDLKSRKIEAYISGIEIREDGIQSYVNESFVMFPDWGGCIFWDTMGVGSGDFDELSTDNGDFKLNVPGLQKWGDFYDNHDNSQTFEQWWQEGWKLAKEIRRQLPDRIDLYYMCFDPKSPDEIIDYNSWLPRIIVPREQLPNVITIAKAT